MERTITKAQARRFILRRQGLIGEYRYHGVQGVIDFTRAAGCVQYDPVDVCGRSPEITYLSRVQDYCTEHMEKALYEKRALVDYFDKNLCILPVEDYPCFARTRAYHASSERRSYDIVEKLAPQVRAFLREHGPAFSEELPDLGQADWYWSRTTGARAVMESLYFRGELCVHHKEKTRRCFDFAENCLPREVLDAADPYPDDDDHRAYLLYRRIGAVGMLWDRRSDAHLCIPDFTAKNREKAYRQLLSAGKIVPVKIEGMKETFYLQSADENLLEECLRTQYQPRTELIAPLDSFLWDRKQVEALFDFSYTWEIYTPADKRKYGYYVLPVLQGEKLVGRIECVRDKKDRELQVRAFWPEDKYDRAALRCALERLMLFNSMKKLRFPRKETHILT